MGFIYQRTQSFIQKFKRNAYLMWSGGRKEENKEEKKKGKILKSFWF